MNSQKGLLEAGLQQLGLSLHTETTDKLYRYMDMVLFKNQQMNLTTITEPTEFIIKHLIDSLSCAYQNHLDSLKTIVDVGTGAGFPGIPLAIAFPDKHFFLFDSLNKRVTFLKEVCTELSLDNVQLAHGRAEDFGHSTEHREKYDLCVSRAVASLPVLSEYCLPFVKVNGAFAAYKTNSEELKSSNSAISKLGGKVVDQFYLSFFQEPFFQFLSAHQIIYIKKVKQTSLQFPRKPGEATKKPL